MGSMRIIVAFFTVLCLYAAALAQTGDLSGRDFNHVDANGNPRGDTDLNGIQFELSDIQLYVQYLLKGNRVFEINSVAQEYSSDLNRDGDSESGADLQCLINRYNGIGNVLDENYRDTVYYLYSDSMLTLGSPVAALYLTLEKDCTPRPGTISGNMIWYYEGRSSHRKIVIYDLDPGTTFDGTILHGLAGEIISIDAAAPDGSAVFLQRLEHRPD